MQSHSLKRIFRLFMLTFREEIKSRYWNHKNENTVFIASEINLGYIRTSLCKSSKELPGLPGLFETWSFEIYKRKISTHKLLLFYSLSKIKQNLY